MRRPVQAGGEVLSILSQRCLYRQLNMVKVARRKKENNNLGRKSELIFLHLNLDGSRRSYLHPEGLGGQEFQFTPEVDDYSENTQVKFFLHPTCTSFILRKLFCRIFCFEFSPNQLNCEVHSINDNSLLAENATDVVVVFPPQPNKVDTHCH